jgi:hypothetical protein
MADDVPDAQRSSELREGLGDMVTDMLTFWLFGPIDAAYEAGRSDERFGPVKLIVWTIIAIGVGAGIVGLRHLLFGSSSGMGWAIAVVPLVLPVVGALAHRPPRRWPGLAVGVLAGAPAGLAVGVATASSLGSPWHGFAGLSSGFLVGMIGFALVTGVRRRGVA